MMHMRYLPEGCCTSRRRLLGLAVLSAALPALDVSPVRAQSAMVATDLEVVTVTATSVIVTWTTLDPSRHDDVGRPVGIPADTELRIAPADTMGPARPLAIDPAPTPYHYAEFHGLEPGRRYRFEAYSHGVRAIPALNVVTTRPGTPEATGQFTTLVPPPGRRLRTIALANDVHYGEQVSGLITDDLPPGVRQESGLPPYPRVMLEALLDDLRRPDRDADHLIVAGDLTAEAALTDVTAVRSRLDSWGRSGVDYVVCRGNHDRPHRGEKYRRCPPVADAHDCWGEVFGPWQRLRHIEIDGLRLIGLDTTDPDKPGGVIAPAQMDRLRQLLAAEPDRPTLVYGHHPVTTESALSNISGPDFVLDRTDAAILQNLYTRAPGIFLHHCGHTHRNRRTRPDIAETVEFLEVGAVKEYPGGYSLLRLYEGGYQVNFYKTRTATARRWSTRSRAEYLGLIPDYTLGTCEDRNHVILRDLSGLRPEIG